MDRLRRKLILLGIPVYDISDESEIESIIQDLNSGRGDLSDHFLFKYHQIPAKGVMNDGPNSGLNDVVTIKAFLGVEESAIFFVEPEGYQYLIDNKYKAYVALLIDERSIVDCIEVAFHKINNGSNFYGEQMEIVQPDVFLRNSGVFILRNH